MTGQERRVVVVICFLFLLGSAAHWYRKSGSVGGDAGGALPAARIGAAAARYTAVRAGLADRNDGPTVDPASPVDVNRCRAAELVALPGIGAVKADAIIDWRRTHGPFRAVDDLDSVPGIGPATVERIRLRVTVGEAGRTAPRDGGEE